MGTELTVAIKGGLRKSAKEVLEHSDDLKKTAKNTDEAKEIEEVIKHLEEVSGIQRKTAIEFQAFVNKWKGKSIKGLSKIEISKALRGTTEQANKIADIIENGKMKFTVWDDAEFERYLISEGDTIDEATHTAAFTMGDRTYYRASTPVDEFMSEIVHEGTHALDNLKIRELKDLGKSQREIDVIMGNNWSSEKRAYFHERAFQKATGMRVEYDSTEEMLDHIYTNYNKH